MVVLVKIGSIFNKVQNLRRDKGTTGDKLYIGSLLNRDEKKRNKNSKASAKSNS